MLYLEDYLEMIEHLPGELRDRFTEMRELDLTVHNNVDSIEKKARVAFSQCKRRELDELQADTEFNNLRKEFHKTLEDADEKVNISKQVLDLVQRYLRRLDSELYKFKCELEADNNGITEILERRSYESENNTHVAAALIDMMNFKENQDIYDLNVNNFVTNIPKTPKNKELRYRSPRVEKRRHNYAATSTVPEKRANTSTVECFSSNIIPTTTVHPISPGIGSLANVMNVPSTSGVCPSTPSVGVATNSAVPVSYNLQQLGSSASTAIAAAASQAIVATQQMQQGRRTASLKASYEAIHGSTGGPTEFWISRDLASVGTVAAALQPNSTGTVDKKQKKKSNANMNSTILSSPSTYTNPGLSSGLSIASSSSSLSADSIDMIPTAAGISAVSNTHLPVAANNSITNSLFGFSMYSSITTSTPVIISTDQMSTATGLINTQITTMTSGGEKSTLESTVDPEWTYDPNEPRYCTCNQVSYGDMVACDNDNCPYEWFHYPCVGITQPPKGKWFCPKCTVLRRRGGRKN